MVPASKLDTRWHQVQDKKLGESGGCSRNQNNCRHVNDSLRENCNVVGVLYAQTNNKKKRTDTVTGKVCR
jgi:hypothetical protein